MKGLRRVANVLLAVLAGILFPLIWWVILAISLRMMFQEWRLRHAPARTIGEILTAAGFAVESIGPAGEKPVEAIFSPRPISGVHELLARAGL